MLKGAASLSKDFLKWLTLPLDHVTRTRQLPLTRLREVALAEISKVPELRLAKRVTHAKVALLVTGTGGLSKAFSSRAAVGGGRSGHWGVLLKFEGESGR